MKRKGNHIKPVWLITLVFLCLANAKAQDLHFSQFFETPLLRNPSLAGIFTGDIRVQAVYRDQWNSITDAYRTGSLSAEYKMPVGKQQDYFTTGMEILYDRAGTVSWVTTQLMPVINYHKSLSTERNNYLSLGFMGGLVQSYFDRSKMTTNSQYDGMGDGETFSKAQFSYLDGSVGMSYNTQLNENPSNNIFFGLAYHHFNRPKHSFYRNLSAEVDPKWVASTGVRFGVTEESYLTLQGDYSIQGRFKETVFGALYGMKLGEDPEKPLYTLHGGLFVRMNDAIIPVIKLDYAPFSVSLSYDVNISQLVTSSYGRGGFELGVSFIGFTNKVNSTIHAVNCPRF